MKTYFIRDAISSINYGATVDYDKAYINDMDIQAKDDQHALELAQILKQIDCKINLIPCNPIKDASFMPSSQKKLMAFQSTLQKQGYHVTIRKTRGDDINAACGQLAETFLKTNKSLVSIQTA